MSGHAPAATLRSSFLGNSPTLSRCLPERSSSRCLSHCHSPHFALLANPVFDKPSERTRSRFGMRGPWLMAGVISVTSGLLVIALAPNMLLGMLGWCLAQLSFYAPGLGSPLLPFSARSSCSLSPEPSVAADLGCPPPDPAGRTTS